MKLIASWCSAALLVATFTACPKSSAPPATGDAAIGGSDAGTVVDADCTTTFRYVPAAGSTATTVAVSGEWNNFDASGVTMTGPDSDGAFSAHVQLSAGLVAYNFIVDGNWILDPNEHWQKYVGGIVNSAVQVPACTVPTLSLTTNATTRATAGQGHYTATIHATAGHGSPAIDAATIAATIRKDNQTNALTTVTYDAATSSISVDAPHLADGKYTVFVTAKDLSGQATAPLRLVFWVEAETFVWQDAFLYMIMTDRFKNGNTGNDPLPITMGPGGSTITVDPRVDYHGGDLAGVTSKINDGTFDQLGITVLWLSPFNTNPNEGWASSDNVHYVSGFHGYWPTKAREVDPRFGTADELHAMVAAAHAHGIRVIQDLVVQHVHSEHEYLAQHPDWFNSNGCICGTDNCDWTVHRLDCLFTSYLPNIDWTSTAGAAQWEADAIWWLDTFDLDGFRMDAVKQVPDIAVINLVSAVRGEFEASGTKVFMTGETAMGWVDNTLADNVSQYSVISEYINPDGLNGQFDFPLYYAVPLNVFANQNYGMDHADYWVQASGWEYPLHSIMSSYIGSQDTARFITIATYRGQDSAHDGSIPYNQWDNIAGPPTDSDTYARHRLALTWLMTLPGAPMIYYGDEYGEYGGVDPNNRVNWRGDSSALSNDEKATLAWTRKVGTARKDLPAMRRGAYVPIFNTNSDVLVFARQDNDGNVALVAISRLTSSTTVTVALPPSLQLAEGTTLQDHLGGTDVVVTSGTITVSLGAQSAAILAP